MNETNSCSINYQLIPIGKTIGPYEPHQIWAEPDIQHAAAYMQRLVDVEWRKMIGLQGAHTIRTHFSHPKVLIQTLPPLSLADGKEGQA
ncbi:hypothetical protein [Paenibacillus prosopidis]|uniref:Uncharacterized protein n=1 Tax=Paenibacillus prosopidis TaxID=630520 RepID=A0A368W710_9BACL|nr:hypothetical protein [Paenibacillus prosopidis]RCW50846.1 hypothetical protein DFP97_10238 [Paenibacillus prosopidis]